MKKAVHLGQGEQYVEYTGGMNAHRRLNMTKITRNTSSETYISAPKNSHEEHLFCGTFFLSQ